ESETLYQFEGDVPGDDDLLVPLGVGRVARAGSDATIISWSRMLQVSLQAAERLAAEGIDCEVVDLRTLRPLDEQIILDSVAKTHRAVVAYEGWPYGGVGAEVVDRIQRLAFDELDAPILRVTTLDVPMPYNAHLEQHVIAQPDRIIAAVKEVSYARSSWRA
ncbi:MAG TPA: alpha-ketoacid dehydrogenase subunit beta, partial [Sorangium sp.]|nr:alpha-ketoacid dehydrogenase subunit beta [Sorangium sp.]